MSDTSPQTPNHELRFGLALAAAAVVLVAVVLSLSPGSVTHQLKIAPGVASVEHSLTLRHRDRALGALKTACRREDCACGYALAKNGLDVDIAHDVLKVLNAMRACPGSDREGMRAEALVRSGDRASGVKAAELVLQARPNDAFALQARALSHYEAGELPAAAESARAAVGAGRGDAGTLLVGLIAYHRDDLAAAQDAFKAVLKAEPDDVEATYNLALVAQRQGSYGVARWNYLKVTRLAPRNQDARHNLALLAHSVGATEEAKHHAAKFLELNPVPARAASLAAALERPPEGAPTHVLKLGAPAVNSPAEGASKAP